MKGTAPELDRSTGRLKKGYPGEIPPKSRGRAANLKGHGGTPLLLRLLLKRFSCSHAVRLEAPNPAASENLLA